MENKPSPLYRDIEQFIKEFSFPLFTDEYEKLEDEKIFVITVGKARELIINLQSYHASEISKLKEDNNELRMDNMAHEYNEAEAERFRAEYERQLLEEKDAEISKLKEEIKELKLRLSECQHSPDAVDKRNYELLEFIESKDAEIRRKNLEK